MSKPVVALEFNELSPRLMMKFIEAGHLPNFARLRSDSQCYITDAEETSPHLEPWIQWVSAHSGLSYAEHGVFNLGDANKVNSDSIWDVASRHDRSVWICGSMNAAYKAGVKGRILPDPWSVSVRPNDPELEPYFSFVKSQVLEHTRAEPKYHVTQVFRFARFMLGHGLRVSTVFATLKQIVYERFKNLRWKRPAILDRFQFDVFRFIYLREAPCLSTFFLNTTAYYQHRYWRNLEPELFDVKPEESEQAVYAKSILFGYQSMDRIVGEVLDMVGDDGIVVFATALSQQPCLKYEASGGKTFYKPDCYARVFRALGIDPSSCSAEPIMSEEFQVRFSTELEAATSMEKFAAATVDGKQAFICKRNGNSLVVGCAIHSRISPDAIFRTAHGSSRFFELFYAADTTKSGMHHPHGMLWMRLPGQRGRTHEQRVPLLDVAPTLLGLLELPVPSSMKGKPIQRRNEPGEQRAVA